MPQSHVVVLRTKPDTILDDYQRLMRLAGYERYLSKENETLIKLNLSWTKYFPSCSSEPWQVEGVIKTFIEELDKARKTIVDETAKSTTYTLKNQKTVGDNT